MRFLIFSLLASPSAVFAAAHDGVTTMRQAPELSDIALFAVAALGIWFVRRAMRARFAKRRKD